MKRKWSRTSVVSGVVAASVFTIYSDPVAAKTVGGIVFDDNAFADVLLGSSGTFTTAGGDLSFVLTDDDEGTYAFSFTPGAYVDLGFTDNFVQNRAGADLALFELGIPDSFGITIQIGGMTKTYTTVGTGGSAGGFNLNVALVDLTDFGFVANALVDNIRVGMDIGTSSGTVPSLSLVGAINSVNSTVVPIPAALPMLLSAIGGLGFVGWRTRKSRD